MKKQEKFLIFEGVEEYVLYCTYRAFIHSSDISASKCFYRFRFTTSLRCNAHMCTSNSIQFKSLASIYIYGLNHQRFVLSADLCFNLYSIDNVKMTLCLSCQILNL